MKKDPLSPKRRERGACFAVGGEREKKIFFATSIIYIYVYICIYT